MKYKLNMSIDKRERIIKQGIDKYDKQKNI